MTEKKMSAAKQTPTRYVDALFGVASGRIRHTYAGACPDDVEGWDSRDPECPACRVLLYRPMSTALSPTDCPTCGRSLKDCQDCRAKGWDNCCQNCDQIGQMENHRVLFAPEER